ncbi:MAG: NUDIX hydrolase [Blastocatellia bacterium]|jgi:ADP-ribose pyrophosphatase
MSSGKEKSGFTWLAVETAYREARPSKHGEELRWILNRETIRQETTGEVVTRGAIRHPGICVIVPEEVDGRVLLLRQYRYPADRALWELPAGTLAGRETPEGRMVATESPAACAHRELLEETGYRAEEMIALGSCYAMPGSSDERIYLFLARQLRPEAAALDIGEVVYEVRAFSWEEIEAMIDAETIEDAKTLVGLFRWRRYRDRGGSAK